MPINWQIVEPFSLSSNVKTQKKIDYIKHFDPLVAEIESNLLLNGFSPWPNFESLVDRPVRKKRNFSNDEGVVSNSGPLPPMEGLNKQVAGMLERKHQIILYGPPGTGKTFHAVRVAREIIARENFNRLSAELSSAELERIYGGVEVLLTLRFVHSIQCIPMKILLKGIGRLGMDLNWNRVFSEEWSMPRKLSHKNASC